MTRPIQLHADLSIDRVREAKAVEYFETVYRPTRAGSRATSICGC
jgi:hypothetical protein